jgi:hypothetical protein
MLKIQQQNNIIARTEEQSITQNPNLNPQIISITHLICSCSILGANFADQSLSIKSIN